MKSESYGRGFFNDFCKNVREGHIVGDKKEEKIEKNERKSDVFCFYVLKT